MSLRVEFIMVLSQCHETEYNMCCENWDEGFVEMGEGNIWGKKTVKHTKMLTGNINVIILAKNKETSGCLHMWSTRVNLPPTCYIYNTFMPVYCMCMMCITGETTFSWKLTSYKSTDLDEGTWLITQQLSMTSSGCHCGHVYQKLHYETFWRQCSVRMAWSTTRTWSLTGFPSTICQRSLQW